MSNTIRTVLTSKDAAIYNYIQFMCHTQIPFWGSKDRGYSYLSMYMLTKSSLTHYQISQWQLMRNNFISTGYKLGKDTHILMHIY